MQRFVVLVGLMNKMSASFEYYSLFDRIIMLDCGYFNLWCHPAIKRIDHITEMHIHRLHFFAHSSFKWFEMQTIGSLQQFDQKLSKFCNNFISLAC